MNLSFLRTQLGLAQFNPQMTEADNAACKQYLSGFNGLPDYSTWEPSRIAILTIQAMGDQAGVYAGEFDGEEGPLTRKAEELMVRRWAATGTLDPSPEELQDKREHEPASIRYRNPGAMYPGPSSKKYGSTEYKVIGGGHLIAVFSDDISGAAAQFDLLYTKYTGMTLRAAITKWCGNNSADAYTRRVCSETGLRADSILTKDMIHDLNIAISFCKAAAHVEAGKAYPMSDADWAKAHVLAMHGVPGAGQVGV